MTDILTTFRAKATPSYAEACEIIDAAFNGDLHHVDGPFVKALDELATDGSTTFAGCDIARLTAGLFQVESDGMIFTTDGAILALIEAEAEAQHREMRRRFPNTLPRAGWSVAA